MKHKTLIFSISAVLLVSILIIFANTGTSKKYADVFCGDELLRTIDLSTEVEAYEIPIETDGHINIIRVDDGKVSVVYADCPDKLCVNQGASDNFPIVCLPNKVYIKFKNTTVSLPDAVSR